MKTTLNHRTLGCLLLIFLWTLSLHVGASIPEGEASLEVHCQAGLEHLGNRLLKAYEELHPDTDIRMHMVPESDLKASMETADLLLAGKGCLPLLGADAGFRMVVGRKVLVPVINARHPQHLQVMEKGLSRERIAAIYSGQEGSFHPVMPGDACFQAYLEDFAGLSTQHLRARIADAEEQMPGIVRDDPMAIGFCSFACLLEQEKAGSLEGLSIVPLDMDGTGNLEHRENFYGSVAHLQHAIFLGKYPPSLYGRIYALAPSAELPAETKSLLSWMIGDGQDLLAGLGIVSLDPSEQLLEAQNLARPVPQETAQAEGTPQVIRMVLALLGVLGLLLWVVFRTLGRKPAQQVLASGHALSMRDEIPAGYYFDKSHTWSFLEKEGTVRIGLDAFLLDVTGPLSRVALKQGLSQLKKGEPFLQLIQEGKQLEVLSPVSGQLVEVNPALSQGAGLLNQDPFGAGWICRVKPAAWTAEIRSFFMGSAYRDWVGEELERLKSFLVRTQPALQDGGAPVSHVLRDRSPREWEDFQTGFLNK